MIDLERGDIVQVMRMRIDGGLVREEWIDATVMHSNAEVLAVMLPADAAPQSDCLLALPVHEHQRLWRRAP